MIRNLLKVDAFLIPMSEQPVDLMALDREGHEVYGEVNIDQLDNVPQELMLTRRYRPPARRWRLLPKPI